MNTSNFGSEGKREGNDVASSWGLVCFEIDKETRGSCQLSPFANLGMSRSCFEGLVDSMGLLNPDYWGQVRANAVW